MPSKSTIAVVESDPAIGCPKCGVINRYDAAGVRKTLRQVDAAIDEFKKAFKRFGK